MMQVWAGKVTDRKTSRVSKDEFLLKTARCVRAQDLQRPTHANSYAIRGHVMEESMCFH